MAVIYHLSHSFQNPSSHVTSILESSVTPENIPTSADRHNRFAFPHKGRKR
jgi:hypothetical protein